MKSERRLFPSSCKITNPFLFPYPGGYFRCAASEPPVKVFLQMIIPQLPRGTSTLAKRGKTAYSRRFPHKRGWLSPSSFFIRRPALISLHLDLDGLFHKGFQLVPGFAFRVRRKQEPSGRGVNIIMTKHIFHLIHGRYLL